LRFHYFRQFATALCLVAVIGQFIDLLMAQAVDLLVGKAVVEKFLFLLMN